jgi:multiple sugar transport system substrate-binding protein
MRLRELGRGSRRNALQRLGAAAALLTLGGCGRRDDPEGPLNFWAMGREAEVVAELLPAFHARHPDIRVHVQQLPWTAAHEKLLTAYAGDSLP